MCAGTLYWANIGTVIYGVEESKLKDLTGDHKENPTLALDCRTLFSKGQKTIRVIGPVPEVEAETLQLHKDFWK